ncbi:SLAC1 anion channel family protein [Curvivirga aplysinae]|uniref:SLAC1 anion channel family protein n=1 Tax=Curvivirga aplysinae TaxID=2529852 RepID=UPI0012BCADB7|nr:SLAC1 anion channel family protein [Curvivirga aplysinae]MTI09296.1 hypothetical protein [Curvivirga aplysinae]
MTDATKTTDQNSAVEPETEDVRSIKHFPVAMFAGSLGICGLALAWRLAAESFGLPMIIFKILMGFGIGYTIAVSALYITKAIRHWNHIPADISHPVRGNFLSAAGLGVMLIAYGIQSYLPNFASILWLIAALFSIFMAIVVMNSWIKCEHKSDQITPAIFIPAVGLIIGPMTGADMGHDLLCWMMLGAGAFGWLAILPVVLNRLFFHAFMSPPLRPSMFVMIAPPAVVALALTRMDGGYMDNTARMLTGMALFTFFYVAAGWRKQMGIPFGLPWWGYTFPMSALTSALFYFYESSGEWFVGILAIIFLVLTTAITTLVTVKTLMAFAKGHLFRAPKF